MRSIVDICLILRYYTHMKTNSQEEEKKIIRDILKSHGLSIKWLATQLNKSEGTVRNWFYSGEKIISENMGLIAHALLSVVRNSSVLKPEEQEFLYENVTPSVQLRLTTEGRTQLRTWLLLIEKSRDWLAEKLEISRMLVDCLLDRGDGLSTELHSKIDALVEEYPDPRVPSGIEAEKVYSSYSFAKYDVPERTMPPSINDGKTPKDMLLMGLLTYLKADMLKSEEEILAMLPDVERHTLIDQAKVDHLSVRDCYLLSCVERYIKMYSKV